MLGHKGYQRSTFGASHAVLHEQCWYTSHSNSDGSTALGVTVGSAKPRPRPHPALRRAAVHEPADAERHHLPAEWAAPAANIISPRPGREHHVSRPHGPEPPAAAGLLHHPRLTGGRAASHSDARDGPDPDQRLPGATAAEGLTTSLWPPGYKYQEHF